MKKSVAVLLSLILLFSFAACGAEKKLDTENLLKELGEVKTVRDGEEEPAIYDPYEMSAEECVMNLGLELSDVEEIYMACPMMMGSVAQVVIVKPAKGAEEKIQKAIDEDIAEGISFAEDFGYMPQNAVYYRNCVNEKYNGYMIYIVSTDSQALYTVVKNHIK